MSLRALSMDVFLAVLLSAALGAWVHPRWFFLTAFVGLNLLQSGFTNWCPMITFLRKLGVHSSEGRMKA